MKTRMPNRSTMIVFLLIFLTISMSACSGGNGPIVTLPAAETPVLETILDLDHNLIAPFHPFGGFEMMPGSKLELRLRAPWPSIIQIKIEDKVLPEVKDTASHPELDSTGYYRIIGPVLVSSNDPRLFWRVLVVLPLDKRGDLDYGMSIHNISQNESLSGPQKEAPPLGFFVFRRPVTMPKPSSVFFDGPDAKHHKVDGGGLFHPYDGALIAENITLAGWLEETPSPHDATNNIEDIHYGIWLDNDFIERNYGPTTPPLATALMPGRWYTKADDILHPRQKIPLTGGQQPNASTFQIMGLPYFQVELNAWHRSRHNNDIPSGWSADPDPGSRPDVFWPFNFAKPYGIGPQDPALQEGDYVIITGALVEDSGHLHPEEWDPNDPASAGWHWQNQCWHDHYTGHGGWLEIHPLDSLRRVKAPVVRKHTQLVQLCDNDDGTTPTRINANLTPILSEPPTDNSLLQFREIIDDRFTDMATVDQHIAEISPYEPSKLHLKVSLKPGVRGHFKAVYLLWWQEGSTPRPTPVPRPTRSTEPTPEELPVCSKKPYLPQCSDPTYDQRYRP